MDLGKLDEIVQGRGSDPFDIMEVLQDIQAVYHYLPEETLCRVSETMGVPLIEVFRLANFYKAFALKPKGKHLITVCMGTACHVRGAPRFLDEVLGQLKIKPAQTTEDGLFTVETVNCLGACALAPVVILDGQYHGQMTAARLRKLIQSVRKADQQAAVRSAVNRELGYGGDLAGDQMFSAGDEIVKDVLFAIQHAGLVPLFAVLAAAAQVGDHIDAARVKPNPPGRVEAWREARSHNRRSRRAALGSSHQV
jgi:NADH:ubiquinone oxidoreductase subunit E